MRRIQMSLPVSHDCAVSCDAGSNLKNIFAKALSSTLPKLGISPLAVLLALGLLAAPALAQNSNIQGQITDPQGAAVPGAKVTVINVATGVAISVNSNQTGLYVVPNLLAGKYIVQASSSGFGTAARNNVELDVAQTIQLDFSLQLGHLAQTITVTEAGEVLNTQTTTVGQVVSNQQVNDLPLNGRNYLQLATLTPGSAPANQSRAQTLGSFSALGQTSYQMNILLDGVWNNTTFNGGELGYQAQAVEPPVDAINEFEVVTNNNSAEYGLRMGGTVIASIKSGTNKFHGDAWEFLRNTDIDAASFFASGEAKPPLEQNQFGGTLGGPIIKNNTFFFGSYQGTRIHSGNADISTLPTAAMRQGNFSGLVNASGQLIPIYNPATTAASGTTYVRTAYSSNTIPSTQFDPVAGNVIALYPQTNLAGTSDGTVSNYYNSAHGYDDVDEVDARVDHNFRASERLYARYSRRSEYQLEAGNLPLPADGGSWEDVAITAHNGVVGLTSTFTPKLVNDVVAGLTLFPTLLDDPWHSIGNLDPQLGIKGVPPLSFGNDYGMTLFSPTGYSEVGSQNFWPNYANMDDEQFSDSLLYSRGKHMMKMGFTYTRLGADRVATRYARGLMDFAGYFTQNPQARGTTGNGFADFLLGDASGGDIGNFAGESVIMNNYGLYFQDDFHVSKKLTLNLGVRWDLMHPPTYRGYQAMSRFDPFPGTAAYDSFQNASSNSDCACDVNAHNFAPRVGLAYQLFSKTVVRAGFGVFFGETDAYNESERYNKEPPQWTEVSFSTDELFNPALIVQNGFPPGLIPTTTLQPNVTVDASTNYMPDQYSQEWFLDVQREFGPNAVLTVSYVGTGTRHLIQTLNWDQPYVPEAGTIQTRRPFTAFSSIQLFDAGADANYDALLVKFEKRYSQGLTLLAAYTYSHSLDNMTEYDNNEGGEGLENNYNLGGNWGNSVFDLRNVFVTNAIYDLPFGSGRRFMNRTGVLNEVLGGWRLGGIWTLDSGPSFSPLVSTDLTNVGGTDRPNAIADGNLPRGKRSIHDWFNLAAFPEQASYTYGNAMRDCLYGPGIVNMDVNLSKVFAITESKQLVFRAEAFNAANTPHFGLPNEDVNLATGGTISSLAVGTNPREFQFALKFYF